jgi:MFS family permease
VRVLVMPYCGRLLDRRGPRFILLVSGPFYALFFFAFMFCGPNRVWPVFLGWMAMGVTDAAYNVAATAALYEVTPHSPARPVYFAIANVLSIGLFAIGALVAIPILHALKDTSVVVAGWHLEQFHLFYAVCGVLMLPCLFGGLLFPGPEKEVRHDIEETLAAQAQVDPR